MSNPTAATTPGSDTTDCTDPNHPCATINYAIGQSSAGDTIDVTNQLGSPTGDPENLTVPHDVILDFEVFQVLTGTIDIEGNSTLTFQGPQFESVELQGVVSGTGNLVEDTPNGGLALQSVPETYTGATSVLAGTLNLESSSGLGNQTAVTVAQGATWLLDGSAEVASLSGAGSVCAFTGTTLTVDSTGLSAFDGAVNDPECGGTGAVVMSQPGSALITRQPTPQLASGGDATFRASAATNPAATVQWQKSTDNGVTWSDMSDGTGVSGSQTGTLSLSGLTGAQSGTQYRAVFTAGTLAAVTGAAPVWVTELISTTPAPLQNPSPGLGMNPVISFNCGESEDRVSPRDEGCTGTYTDPSSGVTYTLDGTQLNTNFNSYTVTGYEVDLPTVSPAAPSGQSYVVGFAVAVCSPSEPSDCTGTVPGGGPVTLTISDPGIQPGDTVYQVVGGALQALPSPPAGPPNAAVTAGQAVLTFPDDPVFLVAQPNANPPVVGPPVVTGGSGAPSQTGPKLIRLGGSDRIATAVAISQYDFPNPGTAKAVVVGRDDLFADDLAGSPFAASVGGPLLLTDPAYLDNRTLVEINRVLPAGGTVYLLGDTSALSAGVEQSVAEAGYHVVRVGGANRWATAVDVAQTMGNPATVFEADGTSTGGAVSASPAAILTHGAILLTAGSAQSPITAGWLSAHPPTTSYAVGPAAAKADSAATALAGADNDATAVLVAQRFFPSPTVVGLATDGAFPDALTGASTSEAGNGPTFLVPTDGPLPAAVAAYLKANPTITTVIVYGGTAAVSDSVAQEAIQAVG